ncbi:MAG: BT4734/BF3469 family protein [Bacteroidota bacterium]
MAAISRKQILSETHYGLDIYAHILREYYQGETVLSISGRACAPARNPFNADKPTLLVVIVDNEALHTDSDNAIADGNAFDFAELHYKLQDNELMQTLNRDLHLHIGEKKNFYSRSNVAKDSPQSPICHEVQEKKEVSFSFFKSPIKNTAPHKSATLLQIYNAITGDFYKERTDKLRSITDPKQARQFKANNFDYCTFSGVFTSRNDKNLVQHSGLMAVDFDHLPNLEIVRQALLADDYFDTRLLFVSPSGDGLKWIIPIETTETPHAEYFAAVANYIFQTYGIEVDKSGRDVSRACFLPHDPNAFIHPNNF